MSRQFLLPWLAVGIGLAGCATVPAPVGDSRPSVRVEAPLGAPVAPAAPAATGKLYTVKKGDTLYSIALDNGIEYRDLAAWNNIDNPSRIRVGQQLRVGPPAGETAPSEAPAGAAVVRPIATGGPVAARALDDKPAAVSPAPTLAANSATLKRAPKGGKLPYSEANLALLKAQDGVAAPVTQTAPSAAAEKPAEKPAPPPAPAPATVGEIDWAWPVPGKVITNFSDGSGGTEASKGIDIAGRLGEPVQAAAAGKVVYVGSGLRGYGNLVIVSHSPLYLSAYAHNSRILVKEGQQVARGQKIAELGNSDADQPKLHFEVRHQGKPVDPLKYLPAR